MGFRVLGFGVEGLVREDWAWFDFVREIGR